MLKGRFGNTSGAPYLEGHIQLQDLGLKGNISFLVDTGADETLIMPSDAIRMGVNYGSLNVQPTKDVFGVGSAVKVTQHPAVLFFSDGVEAFVYQLKVDLMGPHANNMSTPSLLGRDVLQYWRSTIDPTHQTLEFEVLAADARVKLQKQTAP